MADGDDAARHREVLAAEHGAGLDAALDLVEAGLDGLGFRDQLGGPLFVVELGELRLPGFQLRDLGLLLRRALGGLRLDAAVAGGVVPRGLDHGDGPLPAGRQLVGGRLELVGRQLLQQHRVLEPDAALVVAGEQIAHDRAARRLVGFDANETGDGGGSGHPLLGEQALHLPGGRAVALRRDLFPDRHLALAVGSDGEGLQHLQVDGVGPVGIQQLRRGVAETQTLLDDALGRAETRRDGGNRLAGPGELREKATTWSAGCMAMRTTFSASESSAGSAWPDLTWQGTGMVGIEHLVLDQRLHGLEAAPAGDHGVALGAILVGFVRADDQVLQQVDGGDRGLERGVGLRIGRRLADVLGGEREPAQRDVPGERFGPGGDVVHANLPGRLRTCGAGGPLRPPPRPARTAAPLRLPAAQPKRR